MSFLDAKKVSRLKSIEGNGYGDPVLVDIIEDIATLAASSGAFTPAANVAALGTLATVGHPTALTVTALGVITPLVGVDGVGNTAAPLIGVNAAILAIQGKVDAIVAAIDATPTSALLTTTDTRITSLQTKIDAVLAALKTAGLML